MPTENKSATRKVQEGLGAFKFSRILTKKEGELVPLRFASTAQEGDMKALPCPHCSFTSSKPGPLPVHITAKHPKVITNSVLEFSGRATDPGDVGIRDVDECAEDGLAPSRSSVAADRQADGIHNNDNTNADERSNEYTR